MTKKYYPLTLFVYDEISKINYVKSDRSNYLGDVGELLVEYGIKWFFWNKGYRIGRFWNYTFKVIPHFKANKVTKKGGIDFYLKFRFGWRTYRLFIEVKNWDDFVKTSGVVSNHRFKTEILDRYTDYEGYIHKHRLLVIPNGYRKNINPRCEENNIKVIPLQNQIMPELLHESLVESNLNHFLNDFSNILKSIMKKEITDNPKTLTTQKTKTDKILVDIKKGLPAGLISKVYGSSVSYIYKVKSKHKGRI